MSRPTTPHEVQKIVAFGIEACFLAINRILADFTIQAGRSRIWGEFVFGSHIHSDRTLCLMKRNYNGVNNAFSCYKETVQFSASLVRSLFASFARNLWNGDEFRIFFVRG